MLQSNKLSDMSVQQRRISSLVGVDTGWYAELPMTLVLVFLFETSGDLSPSGASPDSLNPDGDESSQLT